MKQLYSKYKKQILLFLILAAGVIFVYHNYFLYQRTIVKVRHVEVNETNVVSGISSHEEQHYQQKLTAKVKNGANKGKTVTIKNDYQYSNIDTEKYRKGDDLFVTDSLSGITGVKRDKYVALLAALLVYLLVVIAGKRGLRSAFSVAVNMILFIVALNLHDSKGIPLIPLCTGLTFAFTIITLIVINGVNKKTLSAICATFLAVAVTMLLFMAAMCWGEPVDYASLDYVVGNEDLEEIFIASILIAGLGAIMDVGVSMAATVGELVEKDADISVGRLIKSGREVGYDIMGTMISVLLFTYLAGLMPMFLIKMKNDISLITLIQLHIPFEITRFLVGGIGILISIPISLLVSIGLFKLRRKMV